MENFNHVALNLQDEKKVVFTALSCRNFHQRMLVCKFVFDQGGIPVNSFNLFGYYLYELVDRDTIRNANNNILKRCDELWVFGEVSDGVLAEIKMCKAMKKPIRFFDISKLPEKVVEIPKDEVVMDAGLEEFKKEL